MESGDAHRPSLFRRTSVLTGTLVGGALLVRLYFLGARSVLQGDEIHYAESLWRFLHGRFLAGVSDYWSFFYPFAAVPFGAAVGDAETGLRLLSVVAGAAAVVPAMAIARALAGDRAATFAGILVALHPNLVSFSTTAATEPLFSLLLLCALWLLVRGFDSGRRSTFFVSGAVLGLAALTRSEGQAMLVLFAIAALLARGSQRAGSVARLARAGALAVAFAIVMIPFLVLLRSATGEWTLGSKAAVNLSSPLIWEDTLERERYVYGLNDEGTSRRLDEIGRESPASVLWRERGRIASAYFRKMSAGFGLAPALLSSPFLFLLVPLGLFGRRWRPGRLPAEWTLVAAGAFPFVFYSIFRIELRYLAPYLPLYLVWGGIGCGVLVEWIGELAKGRRWIPGAAAVLVLASLVPYIFTQRSIVARSQRTEWRLIGAWIRSEVGPGERILAPSGCPVSYYAGNPEATFIPWTDTRGLLRYARLNGFNLLLVDEEYFRAARPTLRDMLDSPPVSDLELLHEFPSSRGESIRLYRIVPAR